MFRTYNFKMAETLLISDLITDFTILLYRLQSLGPI